MSIPCANCGHYIPYADIKSGKAKHRFEPLSEFGPEVSEWTCRHCVQKDGAPC